MVYRLVGLLGLSLLPLTAAADVAVHQALGHWVRDHGARGASYEAVDRSQTAPDLPRWLLAPASAEQLAAWFLARGLYPEAINLDWDREHGAVWVFGSAAGQPGPRLLVDRDRQRPLVLVTRNGVRWEFADYRRRGTRHAGIPGRITRIGPEGGETVLSPR
jgi:hypothetical protein